MARFETNRAARATSDRFLFVYPEKHAEWSRVVQAADEDGGSMGGQRQRGGLAADDILQRLLQRRQAAAPAPANPADSAASVAVGRANEHKIDGARRLPVHEAAPRESFKPKRQFEPNPWMQKPTTTQMASFLPPINHQRAMPFRPKGQVYDPSPFNTTSTAQDAFQAWPVGYRPRPAIYPEEKPYIYEKFECESTSRAAYRAYQVKGYVPAPKPINAMGLDGMF